MNPFVAKFRELHDKAKRSALTSDERAEYAQARRELGRLLLVAQHLGQQGKTLRSALRMSHVVKVELDLGGSAPEKTTTIDLAEGGFAVLLPTPMRIGHVVHFVLQLSGTGGMRPIRGSARVASSRPQGGANRVSFSFGELAPDDREFLEVAIIDAVLARFDAR